MASFFARSSSGTTPGQHAPSGQGRVGFIGAIGSAVGLIYGYDLGVIEGALGLIVRDMRLSVDQEGAVNLAVLLGNIVGASLAGRLATRIGRKASMLLLVAGYMAFALLSGSAPNYPVLLIARSLLGVSIGLSLVITPIYLAELAPSQRRGAVISTYQIACVAGILLATVVDFALIGHGLWRVMLGLSAGPAALIFLACLRMPETPIGYLLRGETAQAQAMLTKLDPDTAQDEMDRMVASVNGAERGTLREIFSRSYRQAAVFVIVLGFFVQITGINAVVFYTPAIFRAMGYSSTGSFGLPIVMQLASLVATITASRLLDHLGRRGVLLGGVGAMAVSMAVLSFVFAHRDTGVLAWVGFGCLLVFTAAFNFGFGSLVWVYAAESFPARLRGVGASLMLTSDLVANAITAQFFPRIFAQHGGSVVFALFSALSALAFVFVYLVAPETKGRPLEEIAAYWTSRRSWRPVSRLGGTVVEQPAVQ